MIERSLAQPAHPSTPAVEDLESVGSIVPRALEPIPTEVRARILRGVALGAERADEIERVSAHTYRVPSCSTDERYLVWLDLRACSCPDHPRAKKAGTRCKHFYAAEIVAAKRRAARRRRAV